MAQASRLCPAPVMGYTRNSAAAGVPNKENALTRRRKGAEKNRIGHSGNRITTSNNWPAGPGQDGAVAQASRLCPAPVIDHTRDNAAAENSRTELSSSRITTSNNRPAGAGQDEAWLSQEYPTQVHYADGIIRPGHPPWNTPGPVPPPVSPPAFSGSRTEQP